MEETTRGAAPSGRPREQKSGMKAKANMPREESDHHPRREFQAYALRSELGIEAPRGACGEGTVDRVPKNTRVLLRRECGDQDVTAIGGERHRPSQSRESQRVGDLEASPAGGSSRTAECCDVTEFAVAWPYEDGNGRVASCDDVVARFFYAGAQGTDRAGLTIGEVDDAGVIPISQVLPLSRLMRSLSPHWQEEKCNSHSRNALSHHEI